MRRKLKIARKKLGLTQGEMAKKLNISMRYYQFIEQGRRIGNIEMWDALEDMTGVPQRVLREED